jgi:vacuolar-type H+-ATPase catalytic subunit A/Vma1
MINYQFLLLVSIDLFYTFDYIVDNAGDLLSEDMIKTIHKILKAGTSDLDQGYKIGEYKSLPNTVANMPTCLPVKVPVEMKRLIRWYSSILSAQDVYQKWVNYFYSNCADAPKNVVPKQHLSKAEEKANMIQEIVAYIRRNGYASREDITELVSNDFSPLLNQKQVYNKITRLLTDMRSKGLIKNISANKNASWVVNTR